MLRKVVTKNRLQSVMTDGGWTDKTLAVATGVSPSFIYKLRKGKVGSSVAVGILLCQVLGLDSLHQLFWVEVIDLAPAERKAGVSNRTPDSNGERPEEVGLHQADLPA